MQAGLPLVSFENASPNLPNQGCSRGFYRRIRALTAYSLPNRFRASFGAVRGPLLLKACHESPQFPALAQEARQGLPRHPAEGADLRHQQEESTLHGAPGLSLWPYDGPVIALPVPDPEILRCRDDIVAALKQLVPDGVVSESAGLAAYDGDALTAYRQ